MSAFETYEHAGLRIELHYDDSGDDFANPRNNDGNLAVLYCWHPRYDLGDEQFTQQEFDSIEAVYREVERRKARLILPLFLYDHSGITISAGARIDSLSREAVSTTNRSPFDAQGWDTSWVGFAYTTEARRKELGVKRDREEIERQVRAEIEEYDKYLRGEVYGYVIRDDDFGELDSCWGFLGHEHVVETANEQAEWFAHDVKAKALNRNPVSA